MRITLVEFTVEGMLKYWSQSFCFTIVLKGYLDIFLNTQSLDKSKTLTPAL